MLVSRVTLPINIPLSSTKCLFWGSRQEHDDNWWKVRCQTLQELKIHNPRMSFLGATPPGLGSVASI
jgi:hypothetical protein